MASLNNWLACSLSPQELPSQPKPVDDHHSQATVSRFGFSSDDISGTDASGECFDLTPPFGLLQDWNSSCNSQNQEPKPENFLGNHNGFNTVYNTSMGQYNMYDRSNGGDEEHNRNDNTMTMTWLWNQPAPPTQAGAKNGGVASQSLSLSMSTGGGDSSSSDNNKQQKTPTGVKATTQGGETDATPRKSIETFGQRTSLYRGVTRHRWTGRYEAHLWDNSCRREGQSRKGRQVYLGGYDKEEKAARAYDLAAFKYWGNTTTTNFPISDYGKELEEMKHMTRQEYVACLRRKSSGFSRGASMYRGVTRHHQHGRWQARIGRVAGNKDLYLGTFGTQEEAAEAYDIAAIKFRGLNAVTNFDMSRYDVKSILESSQLPIGGTSKRLKDVEQAEMAMDIVHWVDDDNISGHLSDGINAYSAAAAVAHHGWPTVAYQQAQAFSMHYPYGQRVWCKQEQNSDANHTFQDLNQLQLGSTHNFLQLSVLHNLKAMESSSMAHGSGSNVNSIIYSNGDTTSDGTNGNYQGVVGCGGNGGYAIPMGNVIASDIHRNQGSDFGDNEEKALRYENMFRLANTYHLSQQSSTGGQASACNNWVPTAVPTIAQRPSNMVVCHGAPTFTVWNNT